MSKILFFKSTNQAYDSCQNTLDHDEKWEKSITVAGKEYPFTRPKLSKVKIGDILIIPSEKVIGIADYWPIAITKNCGEFHAISFGQSVWKIRDGLFASSREKVYEIAKNCNWPLSE